MLPVTALTLTATAIMIASAVAWLLMTRAEKARRVLPRSAPRGFREIGLIAGSWQ